MKKIRVSSWLLVLVLLVSACGKRNEPSPNPGGDDPKPYQPPKTIVYSEKDSGVVVVKLQNDGSVVLDGKTPADKLPKVGEIICSGVTKVAPQGFLYKVTGLKNENGKVVLQTEPADLGQVIPNADVKVPLPLHANDVKCAYDTDGNPVPIRVASEMRSDMRMEALKFGVDQTLYCMEDGKGGYKLVTKKSLPKGYGPNGKALITLKLKAEYKLALDFIFNSHWGVVQHIGLGAEQSFKIEVEPSFGISAKYESEPFEILTIPLPTFTVPISGIPVVFTPELQFYVTFNTKGEICVSVKVLSYKVEKKGLTMLERDNNSPTGYSFRSSYSSLDNPIEKLSPKNIFSKVDDPEFALKGDAGFDFDILADFSLYNMNENMSLFVGLTPYFKFKGDVTLKPFTLEDSYKGEINAVFGCKFKGGGKLKFKVPFTKKELGGDYKKSLNLFELPLWEPFALMPSFSDMWLIPEKPTIKHDELVAKVNFNKPKYQLIHESDYGFAYGIPTENREERDTHWTFVSLKEKYDKIIRPGFSEELFLALPLKQLKSEQKYRICPYIKFGSYITYAKGAGFTTPKWGGDGDTGGGIDDVPGDKF